YISLSRFSSQLQEYWEQIRVYVFELGVFDCAALKIAFHKLSMEACRVIAALNRNFYKE
ncbi:unnamed protein product, partial [Brassica rapa subsp. narinosa]